MTIYDILALCLRYGEKVRIYFNHNSEKGNSGTEAYFAGYRIYEKGIIKDPYGLFPVFHAVDKNGKMSNRLLNGVKSWSPSSLAGIVKVEKKEIDQDVVPALVELNSTLQRESHDAIIAVMKKYAKMHPGMPKIWLDEGNGVAGTLDDKYCSYSGTVVAVSYIDGVLHYDISTQMDYDTDVPDYRDVSRCGVYIEDELYLLKAILANVKMTKPDPDIHARTEEYYSFIKPDSRVRYNDDCRYRIAQELPGPIVTVKKVCVGPDDTPTFDTEVTIIKDGEELSVQAYELEPLSDQEIAGDNN